MKTKLFKSCLLAVLFLFFVSWFYKVIVLMLLAVVWRAELRQWRSWGVKATFGVLLIALFVVMPRYRYNSSDRVRLIYQDKEYSPMLPPVSHYLFNVFFPEEELFNMGLWAARLTPKDIFPAADWLVDEFKYEYHRGTTDRFTTPYRRLNRRLLFPMSGITAQLGYQYKIDDYRSVYLITPRHYDKTKSYPVVFFMHGYLGNWKNYAGVLQDLENCIVLCVGTRDWEGKYTSADIKSLFTHQLPFLERLGYKVDTDNLHIIGLSSGGSASNIAYSGYSSRFKSIAFLSTGISHTYHIPSEVLLIGGKLDNSSGSMPGAYNALKNNGTKVDWYWGEEDTHYLLLTQTDSVVQFLNRHYNK